MSTTFTILGCGSSAGVPRIGGDWGACNPKNSKNRRSRCSLLVEQIGAAGTTRVLIDTSPDMRQQMLDANVKSIDGVWYTHEHADHTHGIDELRAFYLIQRQRIPIWADAATAGMLMTRFAYCFMSPDGSAYPPIAKHNLIDHGQLVETIGAGGTLAATPIVVQHGNINALGFKIDKVAYSPDVNGISDRAAAQLENLDVWIVDALRRTPHPSHFSLTETLEWIERLKPKQAIITNMHIDLDYETLTLELPPNVIPAFDGLSFGV